MAKPAKAADSAVGVRVRMYRVGFGDFFLLSVPANGGGQAHVLIDCGVHAHDIGAMPAAVQQLQADTGGKLALVIMTHRHADHISGFATQKAVFQGFTVERVWMSWFEDPGNKTALRIQAGLAAAAQRLQAALAARAAAAGPHDAQYADMAQNILGVTAAGVSSNQVALDVLRGFKTPGGQPTPVDYYRAGDPAQFPPSLVAAGLTADILGPPTDFNLVAQMDNAAHQYLAGDDGVDAGQGEAIFARPFQERTYRWPADKRPLFSPEEIAAHIDASQPDRLAVAAQGADNAINNQSLIVLFTFAGKTLLFVGDAQWGDWANFLFGGPAGVGAGALTDASKTILGSLDFLKVGHHGSTNATPIDVVNALRLGCCAMCSTDPGAYGNPQRGTEVPRAPLLAALAKQTQGHLARSDQVLAGTATALGADVGPLDGAFQAGPGGKGYIDYHL